ncbi:preprotein translocase subunit SecG [Roseobacter sp. HKCCA0434]|uniref:preprotein translocase subunit SecG n=1 Tax=Roseobacter sp. HKCCA0434 TaxID=3079297 RepID=UPI002905AC1D|nr:preprotein translocase subunit SecG [Roseobacter sp. HKCCA0434]
MENVLLVILLLLALALIGVVLMQRSEGGGLGMGGGGGGLTSGRGAATALSKVTWILAAAFLGLCVLLTILAAQRTGDSSVLDGYSGGVEQPQRDPSLPADLQGDLLPPSIGDDEVAVPPADDAAPAVDDAAPAAD